MSDTFDIVVAGGGHNALVAAAYLTRAGFECCVLDARPIVGGDTNTEELTLSGFRHDTCSTAHNLIQASPTLARRELPLEEYGLRYLHPDPVVHVPFPDGAWLTQWRDPDAGDRAGGGRRPLRRRGHPRRPAPGPPRGAVHHPREAAAGAGAGGGL